MHIKEIYSDDYIPFADKTLEQRMEFFSKGVLGLNIHFISTNELAQIKRYEKNEDGTKTGRAIACYFNPQETHVLVTITEDNVMDLGMVTSQMILDWRKANGIKV